MRNAGLSPRSQEYALALVRQVFSHAKRNGLFRGDNPVSRVKIPRSDNARLRFLTPNEAGALLEKPRETDQTAYEMALLSLHMGLRASEIFKLRWADINVDLGTITIKDSKSGSTGFAYTTEAVKSMLLEKMPVHFFITEYPARVKARLHDFGIDPNHPNLSCYRIERSDYIPDKIEPGTGVLNVIDHFPNLDSFYLVGKYQDEIHRGLDGALCLITHQKKNPDDKDAIGGSFWTITPTLAVTMFQDGNAHRFEIRKGKEPGPDIFNPNGIRLRYRLLKGREFIFAAAMINNLMCWPSRSGQMNTSLPGSERTFGVTSLWFRLTAT